MKRGKLVIASLLMILSLGLGLAACQPPEATYMIYFNSNGGLPVESISTDGKSKIDLPTPVWSEHDFKGWFLDKDVWAVELTENYLVSNPIKADLTVYAKWEEQDNRPEIAVQDPTYSGGQLVYGDELPEITTVTTGGNIALDAGQELRVGDHDYNWTFTPTDTTHKYTNTKGTIALVVDKATQSISATLETESLEKTSITLKALGETYEYSMNETDWQTGNVFENLTPDTEYTLFARLKETENYKASESIEITVSTLPDIDNSIFILTGTALTGISDAGKQLETIVVPAAIGNVAIKSVAANAFEGCAALKTLRLPASITSLDKGALSGLSALTSLSAPFSGATATAVSQHLGYLFGAENYEGNAAVVPASLKTLTFTAQQKMSAFMFSGCENITSLSMPSSLYEIVRSAFSGLTSLESLVMPYMDQTMGYYYAPTAIDVSNANVPLTLKYIELTDTVIFKDYMFTDIKGIESIILPASVTSKAIGVQAFAGCSALKELKIPDGISVVGQSAFAQCTSLVKCELPDSIMQFGDSPFVGCSSLKSIEVPANTLEISNGMFWMCYALETVVFRGDIIMIKENAFEDCYSLKQLDLPASLTSMGINRPFMGNYALTAINVDPANTKYMSIDGVLYNKDGTILIKYPASKPGASFVIPDAVVEILQYSFDHSTLLKNLTISKNVKSTGRDTFWDCKALESVIFAPDSTFETMGSYTFDGCTSLTSITLPKSLKTMGNSAFLDCSALASVTFEQGSLLNDFGSLTFSNCINLTTITIPKNVTVLGNQIFKGCTQLSSVLFEDGFAGTTINSNTFQDCTSLTSIIIPASVTSLGQMIFYNCSALETIYLPAGLKTIGSYAFSGCTSLLAVEIDESSEKFKTIDGSLFSKDGTTILCYAMGKPETSYEIPEGTVAIASYAFYHAPNLTTVIIPSTLTTINENAFEGAKSLTSIYIPINVIGIMKNAFMDCDPETLTIYAEADSKPADWNETRVTSWNPANCPVEWGAPPPMDYSALYVYSGGEITGLTDEGKTKETLYVPKKIDGTTITQINANAFAGASLLKKLYLYNTITTMQLNSIKGADALEWLQIPFTGNVKDGTASNTTHFGYIFGAPNANGNGTAVPSALKSIKILSGSTLLSERTFYGCANIESILLPDTLETIGASAFQNCTNLGSLLIPASVTSIGSGAFQKAGLTAINVAAANTVYKSVAGVMYDLDLTTLLTYPAGNTTEDFHVLPSVTTIAKSAFIYSNVTNVILPASLTDILDNAFQESANLASVTFNGVSSLETIAKEAFKTCASLAAFTFPASVKAIGASAFSACTGLENLTFQTTGALTLGSSAFSGCTSLTSVALPEGLEVISTQLFEKCTSLTSITFPSTLTTLSYLSFQHTALISVTLPASLTTIGDTPFYQVTTLTSITIGESDTAAFKSVDGIVYTKDTKKLICVPQGRAGEITIEEGTEVLAKYSTYLCNLVTKINLPSTLTAYEAYTIADMAGLTEIVVASGNQSYSSGNGLLLSASGDTVTFAPKAMSGQINIPEGVTTIAANAFNGCKLITAMHFPSTLSSYVASAFNGTESFASITVETGNTTYSAFGGYLMSASGDAVIYAPKALSGEVNIPYGVTTINTNAFQDCKLITAVVFPYTLTTINGSAFRSCILLSEVFLPASITTIEIYAFRDCTAATFMAEPPGKPSGWNSMWNYSNRPVTWSAATPVSYIYLISGGTITGLTEYGKTLTSLTLPEVLGEAAITAIAAGAFKDCTALTSITIGSAITTIGANAFEGCTGLTEILVPATVTSMGADVFLGCDAGLTINCEAASQPEGWDAGWNPDTLSVVWGYTNP